MKSGRPHVQASLGASACEGHAELPLPPAVQIGQHVHGASARRGSRSLLGLVMYAPSAQHVPERKPYCLHR